MLSKRGRHKLETIFRTIHLKKKIALKFDSSLPPVLRLVIKAENDRRNVRRPSSCNASQLLPFLVCLLFDIVSVFFVKLS